MEEFFINDIQYYGSEFKEFLFEKIHIYLDFFRGKIVLVDREPDRIFINREYGS